MSDVILSPPGQPVLVPLRVHTDTSGCEDARERSRTFASRRFCLDADTGMLCGCSEPQRVNSSQRMARASERWEVDLPPTRLLPLDKAEHNFTRLGQLAWALSIATGSLWRTALSAPRHVQLSRRRRRPYFVISLEIPGRIQRAGRAGRRRGKRQELGRATDGVAGLGRLLGTAGKPSPAPPHLSKRSSRLVADSAARFGSAPLSTPLISL